MTIGQEIIKERIENYYNSCNALVQSFCIKHDFDPAESMNSWVSNEVGGIVCCGDLYFSMDVIVTDLKEEAPEGELLKWYDYTTECTSLGVAGCNYRSWLHGCPILSEEQLYKLRKLSKGVEQAREELMKCVNELKEKGY